MPTLHLLEREEIIACAQLLIQWPSQSLREVSDVETEADVFAAGLKPIASLDGRSAPTAVAGASLS